MTSFKKGKKNTSKERDGVKGIYPSLFLSLLNDVTWHIENCLIRQKGSNWVIFLIVCNTKLFPKCFVTISDVTVLVFRDWLWMVDLCWRNSFISQGKLIFFCHHHFIFRRQICSLKISFEENSGIFEILLSTQKINHLNVWLEVKLW